MLQTLFQLPTYVFSNGQVTGTGWTNPNNLLLPDSDVAQSNPNQTASDVTLGYSFALPANAVIAGVEIKVIGYSGAVTSPPITLKPYWLDNTTAVDIYNQYTPVFTGLTPTLATYILGNSTYLFGTTITYDQANNFKLNLTANGDISLDTVLVSFFYTLTTPPTPPLPPGPSCQDCNSPIQVQDLFLALPFLSSDRYAYLTSFAYPDGTPVNYLDLGSCGGFINFVIDPDLSRVDPASNGNFAENTVTAVWTIMANGNVQLDFGTNLLLSRGLQFHTPYTGLAALRSNHNVGARVIISDNGPFLGSLVRACQLGALVSPPIEVDYTDPSAVNHVLTLALSLLRFTGNGQVTTLLSPGVALVTITDHFVSVDASDTTPSYLDNKIDIINGINTVVTKTILNPGANEKIQYQIDTYGRVIESNGAPMANEPALNFSPFFVLTDTPGISTNVDLNLPAIANNTTFINTLTTNPTFMASVLAFAGSAIQIDQTPDNGTYGLIIGTVAGGTVFTVSKGEYVTGKLIVYLNGLIQLQGPTSDWQETLPSSGTFTFNTPLVLNDIVTVIYETVLAGGSSGGFNATLTPFYPVESVNAGDALALTKTTFALATTPLSFGKATTYEKGAFMVFGNGLSMSTMKMALRKV